jgi:hypothetical protein
MLWSLQRQLNKRKVSEAFENMRWLTDFQGALTPQVLFEFMELHHVLDRIELRPGESDVHWWRLAASGQFSTKSAYTATFQGSISFEPAERVWRTWAPNKCRFFIWLVQHNRCWTSDKLAKQGMDHPEHCPLCDQQDETINHLLASCVFARQVWAGLLQPTGLMELTPQPHDEVFEDWWRNASMRFRATSGRASIPLWCWVHGLFGSIGIAVCSMVFRLVCRQFF